MHLAFVYICKNIKNYNKYCFLCAYVIYYESTYILILSKCIHKKLFEQKQEEKT